MVLQFIFAAITNLVHSCGKWSREIFPQEKISPTLSSITAQSLRGLMLQVTSMNRSSQEKVKIESIESYDLAFHLEKSQGLHIFFQFPTGSV